MPLPERKLVERIRRMATARKASGVVAGMGDDAAVLALPPGHELLVTTDFSIENVHFCRDWEPAEAIGHRVLARGLSDIAAMGGEPIAALLSLGLSPKIPQRWVDAFLRGLLRLAKRYGVPLVGGDSASAPAITADIVVLGKVPRGAALLRSGARPGDTVCVTGMLGAAAVALRAFRSSGKRAPRKQLGFKPEPRLAVGRWIRENQLASAMIDLSDGLSTDLLHVCEESGVGAALVETALPQAAGATVEDALHGGEDYELLFTASPDQQIPQQIAGVRVTPIGEITRSPRGKLRILARGRWRDLAPKGWEHFR